MTLARWLLTCAAALLFFSGATAASPLTLTNEGKNPLAGHLEAFIDETGQLSLPDVIAMGNAGKFRPLPGNLSAGYPPGAVWLRFSIVRPLGTPGERWLEVGPSFLDNLWLYQPQPEGGYIERRSGEAMPFRNRDIQYRNVVFRIILPADEPQTYYLRVTTRNAMLVEPIIWRTSQFAESVAYEGTLLGGFFGIALIIAISNLIYWWRLREPLYLHYGIYVVVLIVNYLTATGYLFQYVVPDYPDVPDYVTVITLALTLGLAVSILSSATGLAAYLPRTDRLYRQVAWIAAIGAIVVVISMQAFILLPLLQLAIMAAITINISIASWLAFRRIPGAMLYLTAFSVVIIGSLLRISRNLGWLPANQLTEHAMTIGGLLHMVLMNLTVTERASRIKHERDVAVASALRIAHRNEQELEARVNERTVELEQAKSHAEKALAAGQHVVAEQRQFLSMISHEFRTPLSVIDGAAQMIQFSGGSAVPAVAAETAKIRRGVHRLVELLENCLNEDRLESGGWTLHRQPVQLSRLIVDITSTQIANSTQKIQIDVAGLPPAIDCDRQLMTIVLENLLDNARKYSPDGSTIFVRGTTGDDKTVVIEVADQGPGIAPELHENIFKRFYRSTHAQKIPGAGLGLYLVKRIVELHGGTVRVSGAYSPGACLIVELPSQPLAMP